VRPRLPQTDKIQRMLLQMHQLKTIVLECGVSPKTVHAQRQALGLRKVYLTQDEIELITCHRASAKSFQPA
jgi:hypothetical protein